MNTKKHFRAAAERIATSGYDERTKAILAAEFAGFFAWQNPRFDVHRFYEAAGVGGFQAESLNARGCHAPAA